MPGYDHAFVVTVEAESYNDSLLKAKVIERLMGETLQMSVSCPLNNYGTDNEGQRVVYLLPLGDSVESTCVEEVTPKQRYTVQYGPPGRYYVRNEITYKPVFHHDSKSIVISEAERLNGWEVTGSEEGYTKSREKALKS